MDNRKIESIAVNVVENAFNSVDEVYPLINVNDKKPSVDGTLEVYGSRDSVKSDLIGDISVQVKGTTAKPKSKRPRKSVEVADLENYLNVFHGALYFVVFVKASGEHEIYYRELLPFDIQKILNGLEDPSQKTIKLKFDKLPKDPFLLRKLCLEFIDNQKLQVQANRMAFGTQEDFNRRGAKFSEIKFGKVYADDSDFASLRTWEFGTYVYGITEDGATYVLDKMDGISEVAGGTLSLVQSGDRIEEMLVMCGEGQNGRFFDFGAFRVTFGEDAVISYAPQGTFEERLRDAKLLATMVETGELSIGGVKLCRDIRMEGLSKQGIQKDIVVLQKYVDLFKALKMKVSWDPEKLTENENYQLGKLVASIVDGRNVPLAGIDHAIANLNIDIQGSRIKAIAIRQEDGLYSLLNPLADGMVFAIGEQDGTEGKSVPAFFLLSQEDFELAGNIDSELFADCLERTPLRADTGNYGCNKLLQMLKAYDRGAVCGRELLDCATLLANQLYELCPDDMANIINVAQTKKRKGTLTDDDCSVLRDIALHAEDETTRACAYLLLGNVDFTKDLDFRS